MRSVRGWYRSTGATAPFGDLDGAHPGVAMEGYFWRFTLADRTLVALCGINQSPAGPWATLGFATSGGDLVLADPRGAAADPTRLGVTVGDAFVATPDTLRVRLPGAELDVTVRSPVPWPRRRFGGSSWFQAVPALNQYWHPWLLGGVATGQAVVAGERWDLDGAQVYAEKNWGREGFPDSWWWGQANLPDSACVAFAGGEVTAGPLRSEVTALVVRLPDERLIRLGNPGTSPVSAAITDTTWDLTGRGSGWRVRVHGEAPLDSAHVLPVPLPTAGRDTAGALEHLAADLHVEVSRWGRPVWSGSTTLAALENGGLARAEAELRRRGIPPGAVGAPPPSRR